MSGKISGAVWEMDLPQNEKYVLLAYADHADHEGYGVRPGYALVAWKTGYTVRHVKRLVAKLEEKKIMVLDVPGGFDHFGRTNRANEWHIDVDAAPKLPPRRRTPLPVGGVSQDTTPRVPQDTTPVSPRTPQTSNETSNKNVIIPPPKAARGSAFGARMKFKAEDVSMHTDASLQDEGAIDLPSELESLILSKLSSRSKKVPKSQRTRLRTGVVVAGQTHPSPENMWTMDPRFKDYCIARLDWLSSQGTMPDVAAAVNLIRAYDSKKYGWLAYIEANPSTLTRQNEEATDDMGWGDV